MRPLLRPDTIIGIFCLSIIFGGILPSCYSQPDSFRKLTVDDGLSHNVSRKIIQDKQGFIWIATQSGLNRFDGYTFKPYLHNRQDPRSLSDDDIRTVVQSRNGTLLVGTAKGGLNIYQPDCDCFSAYVHDPDDSLSISSNFIFEIFEDKQGQIWVGTNKSLDKIQWEGEGADKRVTFIHYNNRKGDVTSLCANGANAMEHDSQGNLWFASLHLGLSRLEKDKKQETNEVFTQFKSGQGTADSNPPAGSVSYLFADRRGDLWIGGENILSRVPAQELEKEHPQFIHYDLSDFPGYTPQWFKVVSFKEDPQGDLWIIDLFGYHRYLPEKDAFETYDLQEQLISERSMNILFDVLLDHQGSMWLASIEGVFMPAGSNSAFQLLPFPDGKQRSSWEFIKDQYGYSWIGTESNGIWLFDQNGTFVKNYSTTTPNPADRLSNDFVPEIFEDKSGRIWLGINQHPPAYLELEREADGKILKSRIRELTHLPAYTSHKYFQEDKGDLWVLLADPVLRLDGESLEVKTIFNRLSGNDIERDNKGNLWLVSDRGLRLYDAEKDSLQFIDPSPELPLHQKMRMIFDIQLVPDGGMWLGTIRGLGYYHPDTKVFKLYREEDGLIGNQVHSIQRDKKGGLWLGTHKGLSYFQPATGQFLNFDRKDGIGVLGFHRRASFQDKAGNMYFGGDMGMLTFHPDSLQRNLILPQVSLTGFRIFNERVPIQQPDSSIKSHDFVLEKPIGQLEEIRLPYRYRMLSFDYVALNYLLPEKNQYAYKMEGFDENWIQAGETRTATYTNLSPGTYTFRVKASNNDGLWNEKGTALKIIIDPPWYRTWWAFVIYGTLISSIFGLYLYARVRKVAREYETLSRIERAKTEERESVRKRSSRDFHDEAGNKLTKLSLYTELTKRKAADDPEMLSFLGHIENNVRELATGMRDFIWVLDPEKDTLADTLNRLKDFGDQLFGHSDTAFSYKINIDEFQHVPLEIKDKRHLLLIFKEAMNNCLKYAHAAHASLEASMKGNRLSVTFEDDGTGFDLENGQKGNGLKNMQTRAAEMDGNMTFHSAPDQGTRIRFEMEITRMGEES